MTHPPFPVSVEELRPLVAYAVLAPSSHNTQPWAWQLHEGVARLFADRTRALPVNDPDDRELTISCGCALLNLRVAAAHAGLACEVALLPDVHDADCLARTALQHAQPAAADAALFAAIAQRRTYRRRFAPRAVPLDTVAALATAAQREGAWLQVLASDAARKAAAALVAEGDATQWADPRWRRELAAWMHPRRRGDGLTVPALAAPLAHAVVRTFDMGHGVGAKDQQLADESPLLAVLGTAGDRERHWLAAGQALQRMLLVACTHGLQASYLNQPAQVAALQPRLQQLLERPGHAQLLLRIGFPTEALPATPRRATADVIETP
jgi:Nitroreductase family